MISKRFVFDAQVGKGLIMKIGYEEIAMIVISVVVSMLLGAKLGEAILFTFVGIVIAVVICSLAMMFVSLALAFLK